MKPWIKIPNHRGKLTRIPGCSYKKQFAIHSQKFQKKRGRLCLGVKHFPCKLGFSHSPGRDRVKQTRVEGIKNSTGQLKESIPHKL